MVMVSKKITAVIFVSQTVFAVTTNGALAVAVVAAVVQIPPTPRLQPQLPPTPPPQPPFFACAF
jgi:hypothetical protein